jgi:hypothetical protein
MEEFRQLKRDFFERFLALSHGIADESTFRKVINRLEPVELRTGKIWRLACCHAVIFNFFNFFKFFYRER